MDLRSSGSTGRPWHALVEHRGGVLRTGIIVVTFLEGAAFLIASALYLRMPLPVGVGTPEILPAALVEGLCGLLLAVTGAATLARKPNAWGAEIGAHVVALFGILIGTVALVIGREPETIANTVYHRVMLFVIIVMLGILWTGPGQQALGRRPLSPTA